METKDVKKQIPSPQERPDLYDDFDIQDRPDGYQSGVKTPDRIQKLIAERQAKGRASKTE